jgi:serine/threonine protein kinase/Flp pilus assembly protein TadD
MTLAPGMRLGPYKILAPLGAGGMGEVYRAHDTRLGRDVAVKVLSAEFAADPDRLHRFEREARAASALDHPNILVVHDVGKHEGASYLVTELLDGASLRDRLAGGALSLEETVELAVQIAAGLAAAHEQGIVHRDLKPENLFVTRDGRVKILDFGLVKRFPAIPSTPQTELPTQEMASGTEAGLLLGTVDYMSPEQARGEPADGRSDIFSFGCVLFEMLGARRAFQRDSAVETLSAILKEEPPPLLSPSGSVLPALEQIVRRCLEKRPEQRFAKASELHSALQSLHQDLLRAAAEWATKKNPEKSIVVLPFENLSPDPENAYFADGLTEEIIADLAKVRTLRVISRTSAMHYRGTTKALPAIAQELRVRYALEGSVRRAGQSLRITAQLIDAAADTHLWAEKYTGTFADVLDMQEKVSRAIVEALRLELTPQEELRLAERPIPNIYAYECYLKARQEIWRFTESSLKKAMEYLEQGLGVVPDNPLLLAGVGYVYVQRVNIGVGQEDSREKAEAFATRALELAPGLPQAHVVLGLTASWIRGKVKAAIAHLEQVLATDPNDPDGLRWLGMFYACVGKLSEAASLGNRVIAIDPMSATTYMPLVFSRWLAGRFDLALDVLERACRVNPGDRWVELTKAQLLILMGRHEEAFALTDQAEQDEQLTIVHRLAFLWRYAFVGERDKALSWMSSEAVQTARRDFAFSWDVACAYAMLGDADSALDWLENAVERGFLNYRYLGEIDPTLAPLREEPRFKELIARARKKQAELEARP